MLEGLDKVDWAKLSHAYGPATDVPAMIRALASGDDGKREAAFSRAYGNIYHQGSRYEATAVAIPFLIELLAAPSPSDPVRLIALLVHCLTSEFSPTVGPFHQSGPVWDPPGTLEDPVYWACEDAAEPAVPVAFRLLHHPDAAIRQSAAWLLASLRKHSARHEILPRLVERLEAEPDEGVRAMRVFAIGQLAPLSDNEALEAAFEGQSELPRLLAAMMWARRAGEATPPSVENALAGWLSDPSEVEDGYGALPFDAGGVVADIVRVLAELGQPAAERVYPLVARALGSVDDISALEVLEVALAGAFGEADVPKEAKLLTARQRELLEMLTAKQGSFWVMGNALRVLQRRGLPASREEMAAWLGVEVHDDPLEAAKATARMLSGMGVREIQEWTGVLALAPEDVEALGRIGVLHVEAERYEEGLPFLQRAVAGGSQVGQVHFQLGQALYRLGRQEEALAEFETAQPLLPAKHRGLAVQNRIAMLQQLGRAEEALDVSIQNILPADADAWYHRGLAQVKAGRYDDCIASIRRVLADRPDHANAHYTIACAFALKGEVEPALAAVARALECDPDLAGSIAEDSDFAALRDDARFRKLVGEVR